MKQRREAMSMTVRRAVGGALVLSFLCFAQTGAWAQGSSCVGDCNHDLRLTIDELVVGVNVALEMAPIDRCRAFDPGGDEHVTVDELIAGVQNALAGCDAANRPPHASPVSFAADRTSAYVEKQLIGSDPDADTIAYELVGADSGLGYSFAYVNPQSGVLYLTLDPEFEGTIVLAYRVTDGKLFSNSADVTVDVQTTIPSSNGGLIDITPQEYAQFPRAFYHGQVLGAPGVDPTLPSWVDLSADYPLPGNQGNQNSCVAWSLGYAIKSYQERVEHDWSLEAPEHRFSPAYIYNQINHGRDDGLIYKEALDFIVNEGVASLALMPYNDRDFLSQPSAAARQEAPRYRGKEWKAANGILDAKAALANRKAVFMIIQLVEDIHGLRGPDSVYNTYFGAYETGHGVAAVGYDDDRYGGAFKIMNSWGQNWGDGGYFWLPYTATNFIVGTEIGPQPILTGAIILEDLPDPEGPAPDPVDPEVPENLPDLQVTNWNVQYYPSPGGSGSLQYTVTNTGITTAPAGASVALILSTDPTFTTNTTLVVYDQIPFTMAPGTTAYRDANNAIAFYFPTDLPAGTYYMALAVDRWDDVLEANEDDNVSPSGTLVQIDNTLPDLEAQTWYSQWDSSGNGALTYEVVNAGASTAPTGWQVSLVLSPNDVIGDGDEIFLFSESADFALGPGGVLYRDETSPGSFSIFNDVSGNPVPAGVYYLALWLDPYGSVAESNTVNNASLSWSIITITRGFGATAAAAESESASQAAAVSAGEGYNGKVLPSRDAAVRQVRIIDSVQDNQRSASLDDPRPRVKLAETQTWSKQAHARQQVIFPVAEAIPMP